TLWIGQVQGVERAVDENALCVEHRPHGAIAHQDALVERLEEGWDHVSGLRSSVAGLGLPRRRRRFLGSPQRFVGSALNRRGNAGDGRLASRWWRNEQVGLVPDEIVLAVDSQLVIL